MQQVKLKNGTTQPMSFVTTTLVSIEELYQTDSIGFHELVMKCREPDYTFFGDYAKILRDHKLLGDNGQVHDAIRDVVVSAVTGDGFNMKIGTPVQ